MAASSDRVIGWTGSNAGCGTAGGSMGGAGVLTGETKAGSVGEGAGVSLGGGSGVSVGGAGGGSVGFSAGVSVGSTCAVGVSVGVPVDVGVSLGVGVVVGVGVCCGELGSGVLVANWKSRSAHPPAALADVPAIPVSSATSSSASSRACSPVSRGALPEWAVLPGWDLLSGWELDGTGWLTFAAVR
jgi:hypothetical protein